MKRNGDAYTFVFALIICVVCSLSLSLVSEGLKDRKEMNVVLDVKKNILKAVALQHPVPAGATGQKILKIYQSKIDEEVIDAQGKVVKGKRIEDIHEGEDFYPLYIYKEDGKTMAYCFPITGKGLWGPLYGYMALDPDAITIRGVTFYVTPDFKETPGLGAEITAQWFQDNFKGKKIWDVKTLQLKPTVVVKGKVKDRIPADQQEYYVDGVSGATLTSKGVTNMIARWLKIYEPFLASVRKDG